VPRLVAFVVSRAKRSVTPEKAARLELAVEEWVANVCHHAYSEAGGTISVSIREERERFLVEICDEGISFDPTLAGLPDVTAPLDEREPGGLGVLLMRRMLDDIRYRRVGKQNIVTFAISR
jgi:serine/threonine-protein kinase RsbW